MRFIFKTDYEQDIKLLKHSGYWWSYGVLLVLLVAAPFLIGSYLQSQMVFVFIYAIVGVALIGIGCWAIRRWMRIGPATHRHGAVAHTHLHAQAGSAWARRLGRSLGASPGGRTLCRAAESMALWASVVALVAR